jgi:hypothetical protein
VPKDDPFDSPVKVITASKLSKNTKGLKNFQPKNAAKK